jgi:hypothetical protein
MIVLPNTPLALSISLTSSIAFMKQKRGMNTKALLVTLKAPNKGMQDNSL